MTVMSHIVEAARDRFRDSAARLRAKLNAQGLEGGLAYRTEYGLSVPACDVARAADRLTEAVRMIEQGAERERKLQDRVTQLESSTGALMVDRDRGIREAGARAEGAWRVAADSLAALREHGIEPGADLDTLATDAVRHYDETLYRLDAEVQRLDDFRCSIVGLIQQCQTHAANGKGLTPELVGKLGRQIKRANDKACGR